MNGLSRIDAVFFTEEASRACHHLTGRSIRFHNNRPGPSVHRFPAAASNIYQTGLPYILPTAAHPPATARWYWLFATSIS